MSKNERPVIKSKNRLDISMQIPKDVMFHYAGQTGWRRKRDLGDYKGNRSQHNFADQHDRLFDPAVDTLE